MLTSFLSRANQGASALGEISTDPIYPQTVQSAAAAHLAAIKSGKTSARAATIEAFVTDAVAQARRDIYEAPLEDLTWARDGKWSPTAAREVEWFFLAGASGHVAPCVASAMAAVGQRDPLALICALRGLDD